MTIKKTLLALGTLSIIALVVAACTQNESAANDSGISYVKKEGAGAGVVAKFDGKEISLEELEKSSPEIYSARLEVYKTQRAALDEFIRNQVLEGLAKKNSKSMDEYMKGEMESAKKKISDKEVEAFLKGRIPDTSKVPADVRDQVRGLLHMQKIVSNATRSNQVELYLKRPKASQLEFKVDGEPTWGSNDAPITVVEYADFQCYYCGKARERISELKKIYGKKLRVVYKNYPLPMHAEARPAAEAGMCVNAQGSDKFWKFYDIVFDNQKAWTKEDFKEYAKKAGADVKKFEECFDSKKFASQIDASLAEGQKLGVNSTPSFFVNSQLVKGAQPIAEFREIIDESVN
ncbi:MAG TPA: thioredoxin domain-containing protein [Bdellovibrionota bacterium]